MSKQLVLVSHGVFCEALKASTEMIMGPQDSIHTVALLPQEGPDEFRDKFLNTVKEFDDFVVFADLLGGTPCNVVSRLIMEGQDIPLYAGMNMPMVIEFINASLTGEQIAFDEKASENIQNVNSVLSAMLTDDDD